ncbi:MAG: CPBP family intramembrane metalloprotease [Phycisphaerales bacterium]|nr:CPBP family intramembrane metalloprotease [Phycisphaerales bacterium]
MPRDRREQRWWGVLSGSAGLGEELAFRGFMIWYLGGFLGVWWAVVASSVLFALLHVWEGRWAVVVILWMGLVFGAMFVWSGWLYLMIVMHAVHNWEMGWVWLAMRRSGGFDPGEGTGGVAEAPGVIGSNNPG